MVVKMIEWYSDNGLIISFSATPSVSMRVIMPSMTDREKKSIVKYPFINKKEFQVRIANKDKLYAFEVFRSYCWDGASIPRFLHRLIGSNTSPEFLIPSCIHDVLCENKDYIDRNRKLSSDIFYALLIAAGVGKFKASTMRFFVDSFQRLQKGWK